jgi:hypothetical protein
LSSPCGFFHRAADHTDTADVFGARPVASITLSGSGLLGVWFIFMLLVGLTVDLSVNNETKFSFFLWLPLCVLATGCFERAWEWRSRRYAALLVLVSAALPLHMLYFHHAVRDQSTLAISADESAAYAWIKANIPRDAVFIEADGRGAHPGAGGSRRLLGHGSVRAQLELSHR